MRTARGGDDSLQSSTLRNAGRGQYRCMWGDIWDWILMLQLIYTIGGFVLLATYVVQQLMDSAVKKSRSRGVEKSDATASR